MSERFRDVSPEDAELQPIIEGLFGEYAARYGDYFSKDAEVELTEWYLAPQGCLSSRARREDYRHRRVQTVRRTHRGNQTYLDGQNPASAGACRARGAGAGAQGGAGRVQSDLPDNRLSSAGGGEALS